MVMGFISFVHTVSHLIFATTQRVGRGAMITVNEINEHTPAQQAAERHRKRLFRE
jgi:hypothetical protein